MKAEITKFLYQCSIDELIDRYKEDRLTLSKLSENVIKQIDIAVRGHYEVFDEVFMKGEYEYAYDSCEYVIKFYGKRMETDDEEKHREAVEEKRRMTARKASKTRKREEEEKERKLFEKLKKKFE